MSNPASLHISSSESAPPDWLAPRIVDLLLKVRPYQVCSHCVMDTSDPEIEFDEEGRCSHCRYFSDNLPRRVIPGEEGEKALRELAAGIKRSHRTSQFDCVVGVSGGADSTYVVYRAVSLGLRPLAVHFDNGWNSELAVSNIQHALSALGVELYTYVVDWNEFRNLQLSFLKAGVPDAEIPTDHAIFALLLNAAREHRVSYILTGMNFRTEAIRVPSWAYGHSDFRYINGVHRQLGEARLKSFPRFSMFKLFVESILRGRKFISPLNYGVYSKTKIKEVLEKELNWRSYSGKHHESVYTKWVQTIYLPRRFGIDKRRAHFSNMLHSKIEGISRGECLEALSQKPVDIHEEEALNIFVAKKLNISLSTLLELLASPPKTFRDYPNASRTIFILKEFQHRLRGLGLISR